MTYEANLDYLTVTGQDPDGNSKIFQAVCDWQDELEKFKRPKEFRMLGYVGKSVGSLSLGFRGDSSFIIQFGGQAAVAALERIPVLKDMRVTRCDYQVTWHQELGQMYLYELYPSLREFYDDEPNYPLPKIIATPKGDTLYLGKRSGTQVLRLYDKGAEQGLSPGTIWRAELEFKKKKAPSAWKHYVEEPNRTEFITSTVETALQDRHIPVSFGSVQVTRIFAYKEEPDTDKQLKWLDKCVRPAVSRLIDSGFEDEVRRILLGELDKVD